MLSESEASAFSESAKADPSALPQDDIRERGGSAKKLGALTSVTLTAAARRLLPVGEAKFIQESADDNARDCVNSR
jgi:hypothetical protein